MRRETPGASLRLTAARAVIATDGAAGAAWEGGAAYGRGTQSGYPAPALDRVGAGDAFAAGVIIGLVRTGGQAGLASGVERGLAMAAAKLGILGDCLTASPQEIEEILASKRRPSRSKPVNQLNALKGGGVWLGRAGEAGTPGVSLRLTAARAVIATDGAAGAAWEGGAAYGRGTRSGYRLYALKGGGGLVRQGR